MGGQERRRFSRVNLELVGAIDIAMPDGSSYKISITIKDASLKGVLTYILSSDDLKYIESNKIYHLRFMVNGKHRVSMMVKPCYRREQLIGFECADIDVESMMELRRIIELNTGDPELLNRELNELIDLHE